MKIVGTVSALGALVAVVALVAVGGDYDYSALIDPGTLLTDLALMITAALGIAVGVKFAFKGARFFSRAVGLIK
jgi:membrane-associated PAP2 superfamily phosphatase